VKAWGPLNASAFGRASWRSSRSSPCCRPEPPPGSALRPHIAGGFL
jgi:hypothetical protein